eukprot:TRINITY_DN36203_c0_g1_i1.p1 TRINITY_DN36203_c0_g1~~TRINITY_DN36203_c0_g1_i1.p1  ORF type:complete len:390 (+),score=56.81 TRINITY_DN36203_c0_g1_i1:212-1381(+)
MSQLFGRRLKPHSGVHAFVDMLAKQSESPSTAMQALISIMVALMLVGGLGLGSSEDGTRRLVNDFIGRGALGFRETTSAAPALAGVTLVVAILSGSLIFFRRYFLHGKFVPQMKQAFGRGTLPLLTAVDKTAFKSEVEGTGYVHKLTTRTDDEGWRTADEAVDPPALPRFISRDRTRAVSLARQRRQRHRDPRLLREVKEATFAWTGVLARGAELHVNGQPREVRLQRRWESNPDFSHISVDDNWLPLVGLALRTRDKTLELSVAACDVPSPCVATTEPCDDISAYGNSLDEASAKRANCGTMIEANVAASVLGAGDIEKISKTAPEVVALSNAGEAECVFVVELASSREVLELAVALKVARGLADKGAGVAVWGERPNDDLSRPPPAE